MGVRKVVINGCFGGFGLSKRALDEWRRRSGDAATSYYEIKRDDPHLVAIVEEMGDRANDKFAALRVVEIPDDVDWHIHEYDGSEHVAENHRTWA